MRAVTITLTLTELYTVQMVLRERGGKMVTDGTDKTKKDWREFFLLQEKVGKAIRRSNDNYRKQKATP